MIWSLGWAMDHVMQEVVLRATKMIIPFDDF